MYKINEEDKSIYATRGDIVLMSVAAEFNGKPYTFMPGDLVRIKVYKKKKATDVVLVKDFPVTTATQKVQVYLSEEDTKIGEVISKPVDYWYEVELNPLSEPQTIIGYDEDGAKVFKLFPEGADKEVQEYEPGEEEILSRYLDDALDITSKHPVENQVIARSFAQLEYSHEKTQEAVAKLHVTPEMYGAVGDGVVDDTEAIRKMLNDERVNVCNCRGTYKITTDKLTVTRDNITVNGGTFKVSAVEYVSNLFLVTDVSGVTFENVDFYAELDGKARANVIAIHLQGVANATVKNCNFEGFDYDVKIDKHGSTLNRNIYIDGCDMKNSLMPIYVEYTDGFFVSKCQMSISDNATKYEHHIYGSRKCDNHYIRECVFKGGIGNSINYYSAYEDEKVDGSIFVESCSFIDVLCALNIGAGTIYASNINVKTEQADSIFKAPDSGSLYVSVFNVEARSAYLFQVSESSAITLSRGLAAVAAGSNHVKDGATATVKDCDIKITTNACVIYSNNSPSIVVENCILTKLHDGALGKSAVFSVRGANAMLKAIGNVVFGNDLVSQFLYNGTTTNENMFVVNNVALGMTEEKTGSVLGTFVNNTVLN